MKPLSFYYPSAIVLHLLQIELIVPIKIMNTNILAIKDILKTFSNNSASSNMSQILENVKINFFHRKGEAEFFKLNKLIV